ncbi:hypothetical protein BO78DRAFT_312106 [Aspergillus sclerotiicarbonarius CBS 121057]|uniref:Heterokaryon incompatibility domain-containing protein n=1 Tax=Aspergillus sclerotiicarbonarius (strain CBS 121057 / IBT 28362) TaxID=1448318 RepID=A0A319EJE9_ASPSB|nr:hypothetical protein BO78DRAFT_312106 [Aspergillus sclerotiicarbonarius CBS 121057]
MPRVLERLPLDPSREEFRLLTILPDTKAQSIVRCTLKVESLGSAPPFQALSYVWGNASTKRDIIVNDTLFYVIPNVELILRQLRHSTERPVVWIDFICINQHDMSEKSYQIMLFSSIYAKANSVAAVLGYDGSKLKLLHSWHERYVQRKFTWESWYWLKLDIMSLFSKQAQNERMHGMRAACAAQVVIYVSRYWSRVWTFQEYYLAKDPPLLLLGGVQVDRLKCLDTGPLGEMLQKLINKQYSNDLDRMRDLPAQQQEMERLLNGDDLDQESSGLLDIMVRDGFDRKDITTMLFMTAYRQCKDVRDRVYGLYAFLPALRTTFRPDYNKPVELVMYQTLAYAVVYDSKVGILHLFKPRQDRFETTSLPSWVPDLSRTAFSAWERYYLLSSLYPPIIRPDNTEGQFIPKISIDALCLHVWGRPVGQCSSLFRFDTDILGVGRQILDVCCRTNSTWASVWKPKDVPQRFVKACLAHMGIRTYMDISTDDILHTLSEISNSFDRGRQGDMDIPSQSYESLMTALPHLYGRLVFLVKDSWGCGFGLDSNGIEDGDLIIVALGVDQPLALRQTLNMTADRDDDLMKHRFVGPIYLEGISKHDTLEDSPFLAHIHDLPLEQFHIV